MALTNLDLVFLSTPRAKQSARGCIMKGRQQLSSSAFPGDIFSASEFRDLRTARCSILFFQKKEIKNFERFIKWSAFSQLPNGFEPWKSAVKITKLHYYFPWPKSHNRKSIIKITRPDLTDNLQKSLIDALQGVVFVNDSLICRMDNVAKFYDELPRIEISFELLTGVLHTG